MNTNNASSTNTQVEIGGLQHILSEEAQRYLFRLNLADYQTAWLGLPPNSDLYPDYEKKKSVLFINDPHFNVAGQFRIYKGLEIFFRDNPKLISKTVFLVEGYPTNQSVSVKSLIDTDPNPSDELIRDVLASFLVNGCMAYEWKYRQNIPIIGIEDQSLYALGRDYALLSNTEQGNKIFFHGLSPEIDGILEKTQPEFWQQLQGQRKRSGSKEIQVNQNLRIGAAGELVWNITYGEVWGCISTARNREMAQSLITKSKTYENPILFAGSFHSVKHNNDLLFNAVKALANKFGPSGPFGEAAWRSWLNAENFGIYHYLRSEKIGFTFLDPEKLGDQPDSSAYYKLFQSQQGVDRKNMDYKEYVNWLLEQRGLNQGTTVRPSPETAAEFVRRLKVQQETEQKSGVIYEAREEARDEPHWFRTSHAEVWGTLVKDSIWGQPTTYQGRDYEQLRRANLGSNCPIIDDIVINAQTVTSMKTVDLTAKSYQDVAKIDSTVTQYIDKLSGFNEVRWNDYDLKRGRDFQDRYLELGIPAGRVSQEQRDKLHELQDYAQSKDVTLVIVEVP